MLLRNFLLLLEFSHTFVTFSLYTRYQIVEEHINYHPPLMKLDIRILLMPHFTLIPLDNDDETRQPNGWRVFAVYAFFSPPAESLVLTVRVCQLTIYPRPVK